MARCAGGTNQKGQRRSGRMHLHGDENSCTKHDFDSFSTLSTASRVAVRDRGQAATHARPEENASTVGEAPGSPVHPASLAPASSAGAISELGSPARSWSPAQASTASGSATNIYDIDDRIRHHVVDAQDPAPVTALDRVPSRKDYAQEKHHQPVHPSFPVLLLLAVVAVYGFYRWIYRLDFQYQDEVLRGLLGLSQSC